MIFIYIIASLLSNLLVQTSKNSSFVISGFEIIEFVFFASFFYFCLKNERAKLSVLIASIFAIGINVFLFYAFEKNFDFWNAILTTLLIIIYSILFFYEQVNSVNSLIIYQNFDFWVVTGCILYLSGTLFLFMYTSSMTDRERNSLWFVNFAFEIVKNICFSIAFLLARKPKQNILAPEFGNTNMT